MRNAMSEIPCVMHPAHMGINVFFIKKMAANYSTLIVANPLSWHVMIHTLRQALLDALSPSYGPD